jgi:DNA-binding LacI/PurR family transcriptional regulator
VSVVTLYDKPLSATIPNVGCRQESVTEISTAHLIEQGCRRIVHIGTDKARHEGYKTSLRAAGVEYVADLDFVVPSYEYHDGVAAVERLMRDKIEFDGIVAQSDQIAVGALNTLVGRGVRVPEDVKVVGVDDSPYCPFAIVPLSSVCQEETQRGRRAVQTLLDQIARKPVESKLFQPTLVARKSSLAG